MNKNTDFKDFCRYVSQNILSMIGLSCYILVDTYFISKGMGENGLTALNLAIPMYSLINGIGLMLGVGGATRYAITKAQGQKKEGNKIFMNMIYTASFIGAVFVILGIFCSDSIATLLGADQDTLSMTSIYLKMILIFSPAFMTNNIINSFVKNDGKPQLSMFAMLAGCGFNIIFDYVFIFPLRLGMFGAVLATGFAPLMGLLVLSTHFIKRENGFGLARVEFNFVHLRNAIMVGIPSLVTELSSGIVIIVFNIIILGIAGNVGVAAYGVIANISLVCLAICTGIAQGIQPIISEAFGKGDTLRIRNILRYAIISAILLSALMYLLLYVYANPVALVFNRDGNLILQNIAITGIRIYFSGIVFAGINIVLASYFASIEKALPAQLIAIVRGFVLIIPAVIVLSIWLGIDGVWISFPVAELLALAIGLSLRKK